MKAVKMLMSCFIAIGFLMVIIYFVVPRGSNGTLDRINPFVRTSLGYATLPREVTYNGGKKLDTDKGIPQFPDAYKNIEVITEDGSSHVLTFKGGQSPDDKPYGRLDFKGIFVKHLTFVSWEEIPKEYQKNMIKYPD